MEVSSVSESESAIVSAYAPTRAARSLAVAMLDPKSVKMTVAELAKAAGISDRQYYRLMNNPEFKAWVNEERRLAVFRHVDAVITAAVTTAAKEGREGHQDRKMLLEMAGLYQSKQSMEVGGAGGQPLTIIIGGAATTTGGGQAGAPTESEGGAEPDG